EKAIEVLEAIKLFLEVPGTVFVLGMDREVVERGVEARYGALFKTGAVERGELPIRGDVYLQKIVQVPFYLPPLIADDLDHYIGALDENLPPTARLSSMTKAVFAQGLFPNPRQVKRSLNIFRLLRAIALAREARPDGLPRKSVAWPLLAKTVMIQTQYPKLYSEWRQYPTLVQTLEAEYTRQPTREDETLHGRKRPKTEEAGAETEASGGLLAPYLQERRRYVYLERMLTFPESDEQSEGRQQARFEGLSREQMSVYVRLAGAVEGETPATSAQIAGDLMEELLSGDRARIREAVARIEEEALGDDDTSTTDLKTHLVQIMRDLERPAKERTSAGDALGYLGDPRFREDAWRLPDDDLFGFVEIPAGPFLMGSKKDKDPQALDRELPQHELSLGGYYIARFPVTVEQFRIFAVGSGYKPKDTDSLKGIPNHPAVYVTWHDARAYCDWLTQQLREAKHTPLILASLIREQDWSIKLPSEAQWEKAARGSDGLIYPWGNTVDANRANYDDTGIGGTSAVGCFPGKNHPYAVEDLSGNVWEWTLSLWGKEDKPEFAYPYDPDDGRENIEAPDEVRRVLRGGSFLNSAVFVRCACRYTVRPVLRYDRWGVRVVC
ncbi:MAG: SUMF1/EgtB/PvdO family nonheme iron enzyme, partial [Chloroflexi bacterium]|nr:SUMF1/EgtB/PvdO family nonheme iron enzyme [Chloroflexota bacterium]